MFGVPVRLLASLVAILAVAVGTVGGTLAYFTGTLDKTTTVSTATIKVGNVAGFPLQFTNLLPGETQAQDVTVQNGGSGKADFYVQLLSTSGGTDFCNPTPVLNVRIEDRDAGGNWYNGSICNLFPGWSGSTIAKIADDVDPSATKNYRVHLTLAPTAGNAYQGASNTDTIHIIAVQYNGPAPIPDKQGGTTQDAWPNDTAGADDDPNYP